MAMIKGATAFARLGSLGAIRFIVKHWYWIIVAIIIIPSIAGSIQVAKETSNPSYPFIILGLKLTNADALIFQDVQTLKENPAELIGTDKNVPGYWNKVKYYWGVTKVAFRFLGNVWLISVPFIFFYRVIIRPRDVSRPARNVALTLMWGTIFIFIINLLLVIYNIIGNEVLYSFPEGADQFTKLWLIIATTLPFHGIVSLFMYFVGVL